MAVKNVIFRIEADIKDINRKIDQLEGKIGDVDKGVKKVDKSFLDVGKTIDRTKNQLVGLFAANQFIEFGNDAINAASDFETINIAFETFLGSSEKAKKVLADLENFSVSTPFTPEQVQTAGKALLAFGEPVENLEKTLGRIGDISSATGKDFNELAVIYGKARVAGTLYAEDINQLTEAGIPIIDEFAKILGVSTGEVKKLASEGKISFDTLETAFANLTSEGGRFEGLTQRLSESTAGRVSTLEGNFTALKRSIGEGLLPVFEAVVGGALSFINVLKGVPAFVDRNRTVITLLAAAMGFLIAQKIKVKGATQAEIIELVKKRAIELKDLALTRLRSLSIKSYSAELKGLTTAQKLSTIATRTGTSAVKSFNNAIKTNPIGLLISGVTLLIGFMGDLVDETDKTNEELEEQKDITERLKDIQKEANDQLAKEVGELKGKFLQLKKTNPESKERLKLINEINSTYGTTLKNLKDEKAFVDQLSVAYAKVVEEIKNKIRIQAAEQQTTELLSETVKIEKLIEKDLRAAGITDAKLQKFFADRGQEQIKSIQDVLNVLSQETKVVGFKTEDGVKKYIDANGKVVEDVNRAVQEFIGELNNVNPGAIFEKAQEEVITRSRKKVRDKFGNEIGYYTESIGKRIQGDINTVVRLTRQAEAVIEDTNDLLGGYFSTIEEGNDKAVASTKKYLDITTALKKELQKLRDEEVEITIKTSDLTDVEKLVLLEEERLKIIDREIAARKELVAEQRNQNEITESEAVLAVALLEQIRIAQTEALQEETANKIFEIQQKLAAERLANLFKIADVQAKIDVELIDNQIEQFLKLRKALEEGRKEEAEKQIGLIDAEVKQLEEKLASIQKEDGDTSEVELRLKELEDLRDELEAEIDELSDISVRSLNEKLIASLDDKYRILRDRIIEQARFEIESEKRTAEEIELIRKQRDLRLLQLDEEYQKEKEKLGEKATEKEIQESKERKEAAKQLYEELKNFVNQLIQLRIAETEKAISAQEKRVEKAKDLADKGNADILQAEENKLNELQRQKEKFVRAQQALAAIELVAQSTVAIAKAAAEGGAAAPFTIAATLIALASGLIAAKAQAQAAAGSFAEGGYTGDGGKYEPAGTVHKGEFVFDQHKTRRFRSLFEEIHKGRDPYVATEFTANMMRMDTSGVEGRLDGIEKAIREQSRLNIKIDEKGVHGMVSRLSFKRSRIRNKAK